MHPQMLPLTFIPQHRLSPVFHLYFTMASPASPRCLASGCIWLRLVAPGCTWLHLVVQVLPNPHKNAARCTPPSHHLPAFWAPPSGHDARCPRHSRVHLHISLSLIAWVNGSPHTVLLHFVHPFFLPSHLIPRREFFVLSSFVPRQSVCLPWRVAYTRLEYVCSIDQVGDTNGIMRSWDYISPIQLGSSYMNPERDSY